MIGKALVLIGTLVATVSGGSWPEARAEPAKTTAGIFVFGKDCVSGLQGGVLESCVQDKVRPDAATTYLDLLRLIYPDLKIDGTVSYSQPLRADIGGFGAMDAMPTAAGGAFSPLGAQQFLMLPESGRKRLLVLDPDRGTLALLQVEPSPKLLDWIGVSQDQHVGLASEFPVLEVRSGEYVFLTNNWHFNSSEAFNIYNLFLIAKDRLSLVYDGPFLYSFNIPERQECRLDQRLASLQSLPARHEGYSDLRMEVREERRCPKGEGEVIHGRRNFSLPLYWQGSKGKYLGGSKELYRLNNCRREEWPRCP
ncbi:MAG: hypothetical protein U1F66_04440 [bacterium]